MQANLQAVLDALADALENRDFDAVETELMRLEELYGYTNNGSDQAPVTGGGANAYEDEARTAASLRSTNTVNDLTSSMTLDRFNITHGSTKSTRGLVLFVIHVIVESHEELAENNQLEQFLTLAQNGIGVLQSSEDSLDEQVAEVQEVTEGVSVPPMLDLRANLDTTTVGLSETTTATVTLTNSGDEPETDITVSIDSPSGVEASRPDWNLGQLADSETATTEVTFQGTDPGVHSLRITAVGSRQRESTILTLSVRDSDQQAATPTETDTPSDSDSGPGFTVTGTIATVTATAYGVYRALSPAESDNK